MRKKIICFDIDNVVCKTKSNHYKKSQPNKKTINLINDLYKKGFYIKLFTARGMSQYNRKKNKIKNIIGKLTVQQLQKWKVQYHELILYKPSYDIFIDDKALGFVKNWHLKLRRKLKLK